MQITIRHKVTIDIGEGVPRAWQHLLLTPQKSSVLSVRDWRIEAPGMDDATGFIDAYGNRAHLCSQTHPESQVSIVASGLVETFDKAGVVGRLGTDPVPALFRRLTRLTTPRESLIEKYRTAPRKGRNRIPLLHALMAGVGEDIGGGGQLLAQRQDAGALDQVQMPATQGTQPAPADYAHAFIGAARALDIPARFVTGYVVADDGSAKYHAWAEAWDDGLGWIGFDAMFGYCPAERHVRLAAGLDADGTRPVRSVPAAGQLAPGDVDVELQQ
jgi:transglutaminase-like putative cysteine protease